MAKKHENQENRYDRKNGHRPPVGKRNRTISFSWEKLDRIQGQTVSDWESEGLLSQLCTRMQQIGQFDATNALAQQLIKQYTQVGFPPNSKFDIPKHVTPIYWAVIHITPNSKAVVAGYIEEDVFYVVFLDKEHHFWPSMNIQNRGKNRR